MKASFRSNAWLWGVSGVAAVAAACGDASGPAPGGSAASAGSSGAAVDAAQVAPTAPPIPITLVGAAIAAGADDGSLIVADEDHEALYLVPTSLDPSAAKVVPMPGPPAQVVDAGDVIFVTVRTLPTDDAREARAVIKGALPTNAAMTVETIAPPPDPSAKTAASASASSAASAGPPVASAGASAKAAAAAKAAAKSKAGGSSATTPKPPAKEQRGTRPLMFDPAVVRKSEGGLLLVMKRDESAGLAEIGRVVLPPDAWGLALTPDKQRALVTSAWSAKVSLIDVADRTHPKLVGSLATQREPRGLAISADGGTAWVSHLVGSGLTRVDGLAGERPTITEQPLPAGRARTPVGGETRASLGYSVLLSPDGKTLLAPRHALGANGTGSWWGAPVVDTMDVASGAALQPARAPGSPTSFVETDGNLFIAWTDWRADAGVATAPSLAITQPRAAIYRATTSTLLVAGEGSDMVAELDARLPDPAMRQLQVFQLGADYDVYGDFPKKCGAPTGLALSRDDATLYVFCRSTFDLAKIDLKAGRLVGRAHLADDGLPADAALGRRLYYSARSPTISGGIGCAGCHPEGRDDGYVWREGEFASDFDEGHHRRFVASRALLKLNAAFGERREPKDVTLYARQTPFIAGRTRANGPYAWHAEDADLLARLDSGFQLHRGGWSGASNVRAAGQHVAKVDYLGDFLRSGLLPPPTLAAPLSEAQQKGREIFESEKVGCASCHLPQSELTDRKQHPLDGSRAAGEFTAEPDNAFKTPSLMFLAGTAPFFHDGSAATLTDLVERNGTRMGNTSQLRAEEKQWLVSYLESL